MGAHFVAWKSSLHRTACLALYRRLITLSNTLPLPPSLVASREKKPHLTHLIRKQFARNRLLHSTPIIVSALKHGYVFETFLRLAGAALPIRHGGGGPSESVHGDDVVVDWRWLRDSNPAYVQLLNLVNTALRKARVSSLLPRPPQCCPPPPLPAARPLVPKMLDARPRPLIALRGSRRRLPVFTATAHGFPFLRFKKPQSPYLARVLRDKVRRRQKLVDWVDKGSFDVGMAGCEDAWDEQLRIHTAGDAGAVGDQGGRELRTGAYRGSHGRGLKMRGEGSWVDDLVAARQVAEDALTADRRKSEEMGSRMWQIWQGERELWQTEREDRRVEKRKAKLNPKLSGVDGR